MCIYIYIYISCLLTDRQINILKHIKSAHHALRLWNPPSNSTKTCPPRCCQRQPRARGWDRWKPGLWVEVSQTNAGRMAKFGELVWGNQRMITTLFWLKKAVQLWSGCFLVVVWMCAHVLHRLLETRPHWIACSNDGGIIRPPGHYTFNLRDLAKANDGV